MGENQISAGSEQSRYYPYSGVFHVRRGSFWEAGQDSFTIPPAQNQDRFISLSNVEPVLQGTLRRRRGYTALFPAFAIPYTLGYSFRSESLSLRRVVFTSSALVTAITEDGLAFNPGVTATVFTPGAGAGKVRMALSRDYGYFADGVKADYKKWDGTANANNLTNWGIDVNNVAAAPVGPNAPGTAATSSGGGPPVWSNPNNIKVEDGAFATTTSTGMSQGLSATNFGFTIPPTATISGVKVEIKLLESHSGLVSVVPDCFVQLLRAGTTAGAQESALAPRSLSFVTFGGPTDLWGRAWTPAEVNDVGFGAVFTGQGLVAAPYTWSVDFIRITVYTQASPLTLGATAAGNITLLSGRTYFYAFQNSLTGHSSGLSKPSLSTGPLTSKNQALSAIPTSLDPQVDTALVLATADGSDQTTLFLVAALPNGTSTYTDNTPDALTSAVSTGAALLSNALYQNTDAFGVLHGVANNNPPPAINFPTKHKGRIFGSIGQTLYFSKNLDECVTANGLVTGKWEEAWPLTNQMDISEFAETIQGIMSDGETLWIATERAVRRLVGDSPQNFQKPEVQFNETGVLNQEVWKVTFYEGQPVGTMWLTPDHRVMASDFNTYQDVGTPIQNLLNSINPAAVQSCHACFVSKGPAEYYMLYIPTGSNTTPDTVCVFNLRSKKWFVWIPTDQVSMSLFFIDVGGAPRWTFGASPTGAIYEWDDTQLQDRVFNFAVSYPVTIQTSWLDFGDAGIKKCLNHLLLTTDDSGIIVQVDGVISASEAQFNSPDSIAIPTTPFLGPFQETFLPLAGAVSRHRFYRFTFQSTNPVANVLAGYSIESVPLLRF